MILILFSFENFQCYRNISKNRIKNDHVSLHPDFSHPNTFLFPSLPSSLPFLPPSFLPSFLSNLESHVEFSFPFNLLNFKQFFGLSLFFLTSKLFWEIQVSYCVECPSIRVYLLFAHDYISSAYEFLQKNHRSNVVFISVHHNRGHLVDLSRDCLPGFSTTNLFSLSS